MRGKVYYIRELQNTYLVFEDGRKEIIESFTGRMINMGKIGGILDCSFRLIDGKREVKYDVSSLISLEQCYAVKELSFMALRDLVGRISRLMTEFEQNLLEGNGVVYDPKYIFFDRESGEYYFIYDFTEVRDECSIETLAEYCIERIDNKEERAVDLAYYFYEHARDGHFSLKKVEEYLEKRERESGPMEGSYRESAPAADMGPVAGRPEETRSMAVRNPSVSTMPENYASAGFTSNTPLPEEDDKPLKAFGAPGDSGGGWEGLSRYGAWEASPGRENVEPGKPVYLILGGSLLILSLISIVLFSVLSGGYFIFSKPLEIAWLGATVVISVAGAVLMVIHKKKEGTGEDFEGESDIMKNLETNDEERFCLNPRTVDRDEEEIWDHVVNSGRGENHSASAVPAAEDAAGKTVYIGREEISVEHALIGRHRGRDREYPIGLYPWIIGKEREQVNMQINEPYVSRIHARLLSEGGDVFLEDLASTNGTYLNDLPLSPHEKMRLKRGDVILFGRSEFVFE